MLIVVRDDTTFTIIITIVFVIELALLVTMTINPFIKSKWPCTLFRLHKKPKTWRYDYARRSYIGYCPRCGKELEKFD